MYIGNTYFQLEHITNEDDPAPTGSLSINDQLFDDYNEESDQDWATGASDSDSDGSIIDQGLLSHPAFHMDEDDVDIDGPEDESLYQHGKSISVLVFSIILTLLLKHGQVLQKKKKNNYKKKREKKVYNIFLQKKTCKY